VKAPNASKPAPASTGRELRKIIGTGERRKSSSPTTRQTQLGRAKLNGSNREPQLVSRVNPASPEPDVVANRISDCTTLRLHDYQSELDREAAPAPGVQHRAEGLTTTRRRRANHG
jgi:hypothetical protein